MANTPNLDLVKPAGTDKALVSVINSNSDKIDAGYGSLSDQIEAITGNTSWPQWTELTLVNCEAWGAQHHFTKIGKVTYVGISVKGLTANTNTTICTIPTGNRPLFNVEFDGFGGAAYLNHAHFKITAEGAVSVYSADTYATGFICYPSTT